MVRSYPKNEFTREYNILRSLLPNSVYELMAKLDVKIAGGAITSLFSNREINDFDVYFKSWVDMEIFLAYLMNNELMEDQYDLTPLTNGWGEVKRTFRLFQDLDSPGGYASLNIPVTVDSEMPSYSEFDDEDLDGEDDSFDEVLNIGMTDKSVMFSTKGQGPVIQCICFDIFPETEDIFKKFDYTINMGAFRPATGEWVFHRDFLKHNSQKVLVVNPDTDYPIISLLRAGKYQARGYTISRRDTMKLGLSVSRLNISSWQDAKDHLSGMYGTSLEEMFDEQKDFSFDLLFDKLEKASDAAISSIATCKEKGEFRLSGLKAVSYFQILQRLRKHTGREHFRKLYGVCLPENFYIIQAHKRQHSVGLLVPTDASKFMNDVQIYFTEAEARDVYEDWATEGKISGHSYRSRSAPGAVLLEIECSDWEDVTFKNYGFYLPRTISIGEEKVKLTVQRIIDSKGEIS